MTDSTTTEAFDRMVRELLATERSLEEESTISTRAVIAYAAVRVRKLSHAFDEINIWDYVNNVT